MAAASASGDPPEEASHGSRVVWVFDCRPQHKEASEKMLNVTSMNYKQFLCAVRKEFSISVKESFVITTTDRREIDSDVYDELSDGKTLHLLQSVDQELAVATEERIKYVPHFHTIVQSGQYEYYASEGQKALPYAFAELIDNALSATSQNTGNRNIDIRLYFDESQGGPAVVVMDNGRGMTSKELNNWAVYRLSKFTRDDRTFRSDELRYVRPGAVPRSLNSDISYFGVGGKQAVFYIGQSVRIISKPVGSPDVHEFVLSKDDFEQKEKNNKEIYSGVIRNRKPGDDSHVRVEEERFLQSLVLEESGKNSFTTIVITAVQPEHVAYLKQDFISWTRELAHIYHYYVHGIHGNNMRDARTSENMSNIDIQICLNDRSPRLPRFLNLKEIDDDMQTLYINSSVAEFEFKASKEGDAKVEGLLRYHPFLYDRETYPEDPYAATPDIDEDCFVSHAEGRGKRPIFECFWNGRLIPYSSVNEFDWCARPKKGSSVPLECYNRISGVLFTNDRFQVSTNKLTFMDLELQLRDKETIFTRVLNGQEQRVKINREFTNWLKECHEKFDKQVKFLGFQGTITRTDVQPKRLQSPWAKYKAIVWDGKTYKTGQQVKTIKTQPILYGTVVHFLLYGDYEDDVFATGGHVQIALEPKELCNEKRIIPIAKIDRQATDSDIKESIENELDRLPDKLRIVWPEGNPWTEKAVKPAGTHMGPIQVEILNKKGETMSRLPIQNANSKKLQIELKVIWHSPNGDIKTNSHTGVHSKWGYWFRKMENLNKLGSYTLQMQAIQSDGDSPTSEWAGRQLPNFTLNFGIKESTAATFSVGFVPSPVQVGVPFVLPLQFTDEFNHPTQPPSGVNPQLECSSLNLSYEQTTINGATFNIQDLRAMGTLTNHQDKIHTVKVKITGLTPDCQSFQISVRPGPPHQLVVTPKEEVCIENGTPAQFRVEVHDEFQNITTHSKLIVRCQLFGTSDLPADTVDCSNTGTGCLLAKPIQLKNVTTERTLTAKFGIPNQKSVACVERTVRVLPSTRVFRIEVYRKEDDSADVMVIQNKERINWTAGDALGSLCFKLYDEGGRQVALTHKLVNNIKVNWAADVKAAELVKGRLPCVSVPTNVHGEQFYQVAFQDQQTVDTSFTIVPRPDEPERLRVVLSETTVMMGETLSGNIYVEVIDQYGNKTDALSAERMNAVSVSADNLDESALNFDWQTSTGMMVVTGVRFAGGLPGVRELSFKYQTFEELVRVKVTAGPPTKINLLEAPEEPSHVINGHGLDTPFVLQLCDDWGNPVPDQRVVIAIKTLTPQLKVKSPVMSQPVDTEGKVSFILKTVTATIGENTLEFRGYFSPSNTVPGPIVKLCVMPDPNNPAKLSVEYNTDAILKAGEVFPVFKVTVLSEEGGPVKNLSPSSLSMLLWPGLASGARPPTGAITLKCSKPEEKENDDHFYFRDKEIPSRVGKYMVQFVFAVNKNKPIWSSQIALSIVANKPFKLVPDTLPSTPVVSNSSNLADRTLFERLCLKVMDEHNNPAGMGIKGKVILTVTAVDDDDADLPLFENKAKSLTYDLINGETVITALALMENSPGTDGAEYALQFRPVLEGPKSKANTIPPYNLHFRFCNDAEKQKLMAAMSAKKDRLSESVKVYRDILETNKQLTAELKGQVQAASTKEAQLKQEIKKSSVDVSKLTDVASIDGLIAQMTADLERLKNLPQRKCTMPDPFKGSQGVLGKIAHLALVKDDDEAKVISWHILGDMDCVVTVTTAAAKKIYDETQGRQQVMPLETIFWKQSNRPLPHIRNGQTLFRPLGNPVFVRDLLIFPEHAESCTMVFANILGDTIIVDDLDSANHYRKGVVQCKMQCPTLLTRKGERIRSNGKFGGLQNKAPPIEKLRGHVFGAPLPQEYHTICKQKELLQQYSVAVENALKVKADYEMHMEYLQSPQMKKKKQELQQQEKALREIEKELGNEISSPVRTSPGSGKRNLQDEDEGSPSVKRPRRKSRRLLDT